MNGVRAAKVLADWCEWCWDSMWWRVEDVKIGQRLDERWMAAARQNSAAVGWR